MLKKWGAQGGSLTSSATTNYSQILEEMKNKSNFVFYISYLFFLSGGFTLGIERQQCEWIERDLFNVKFVHIA